MKQIEIIKTVALALGELNEKAVFVGGAIVPFYLPEELKTLSRATEDVDVVIEVIKSTNREEFEKTLREKGFQNDTRENAPICRWRLSGLTVDIMSPDERALGFSNKWYGPGIKFPLEFTLDGTRVRILRAPYFLATKFEAFKGRGKKDFMGSHDMEDIIAVFDGASEDFLEKVFPELDADLVVYLKKELSNLLKNKDFRDALPGSVFDREQAIVRAEIVLQRIKDLVEQLYIK